MQEISSSKKDEYRLRDAIGLMSNLGFSLFLCVFIGIMGGNWLDQKFGTSPTCLLLGAILGAGASWKTLYDIVKKWTK